MTINGSIHKVFEQLYQQKALTEKIIGSIDYSFLYAVVEYNAVCTEAVDFTMFDKVICGILQVDEVLSIEEIAEILGLNIVHRPEEGRYIDYAEKEIIESAINSLIAFGMIETGDIHHSRCRLTEIGREYAINGKKFLPATEKKFTIYYDLNDEKHDKAKLRFANVNGTIELERSIEFDLEDESFLKTVAKVQIPEIYNPGELRNFTNPELQTVNIHTASFSIYGLVSTYDKSIRFLAFDGNSSIHSLVNDMIEENDEIKHQLLEMLLAQISDSVDLEKDKIQKRYEANSLKEQEQIRQLLEKKLIEEAFQKTRNFYTQSDIIEAQYFQMKFEDFFDEKSKEFLAVLSSCNSNLFTQIKAVIQNKLQKKCYLIIIAPENTEPEFSQYLSEESRKNPYVFFGLAEQIEATFLFSKKGQQLWTMEEHPFLLEVQKGNEEIKIEQKAYYRKDNLEKDLVDIYNDCKKAIGTKYLEIAKSTVENLHRHYIDEPMGLSKKGIENVIAHSNRMNIFKNVCEISKEIRNFHSHAQGIISSLKELLEFKIKAEFDHLKSRIHSENSTISISELRDINDSLKKMTLDLYDKKSELGNGIVALTKLVESKIEELSKSVKPSRQKKKAQKHSQTKKR